MPPKLNKRETLEPEGQRTGPIDVGDLEQVPTIEHAGVLEDLRTTPAYLTPGHETNHPLNGSVSCSYCGVGDSGVYKTESAGQSAFPAGEGKLTVRLGGRKREFPVKVLEDGTVEVTTQTVLARPGGAITGELTVGETTVPFQGKDAGTEKTATGGLKLQRFSQIETNVAVKKLVIVDAKPTQGCVKLRLSTMHQRSAYPIHTAPSILNKDTGKRQPIPYREAIRRFGDLLLRHREPGGRTLIYASGQIDYFSIFAMQEVFRLLGIRNLTGNAEHCLNAGAVHNEVLTGQEGPFITIDQAMDGPNRVYLLNGWNGIISHPPVYRRLLKRVDLDAYLVEVMVTETAKGIAQRLGSDRIVLIRPRSDAHLALAVAHEILTKHSGAVEGRFVERFADADSFARYQDLALSAQFAPERVADRIAPEPIYSEKLLKAIRILALKLADPESIPIILPSVGLSQSSGIVAHCLWGNVLGMLGKYGIKPDGTPVGGVLRVPGQINAESEVQGLSRKFFLGRIPMEMASDAARRMGLPDDAYDRAVNDMPRAALDYSEPTPGERELFICVGTQFEANMPHRKRWLDKLTDPMNTLVVMDPIPDPWSEKHAALIIPSPPHPAANKLYQNGEWKLSLSMPQKKAAPETRSDATIIYDAMAEITERLESDPDLAARHPDLSRHVASGYMRRRFCAPAAQGGSGLPRIDGEVSRVDLWERVQDYLHGGRAPLYCSFDHADGTPITWSELMEQGSLIYGGVGVNRYVLDYDDPSAKPFRNIYREPGCFRFFYPTDQDLAIPEGIIFNSGRSALTDDRERIHFATSTFNSGKATPIAKIPDEHPLYISPHLAEKTGLKNGDMARVISAQHGASIELPVEVTDRVKGDSVYVSFHRSKAQETRGLYINDVTDHVGRCAYSGQVQLKIPRISIERVGAEQHPVADPESKGSPSLSILDDTRELPAWSGVDTPLYITDIFDETPDTFTMRLQGNPLCRFTYKPGQFCSVVLNINGKKVVRSYSISSTPTRPHTLELTIKRIPGGLVSNWLYENLKVGERVTLKAPKGKFYLDPADVPRKILLIGAGSGITPLMSMARWLCDVSANVDVKFYCSFRNSRDIIYYKELDMMSQRYRMFSSVIIATTRDSEDGANGMRGRLTQKALEEIAPDIRERRVYLCGPNGFMDHVKSLLREIDFDLSQLHTESFGGTRTAPVEALQTAEGRKVFSIQFAQTGKKVIADGSLPLLDLAEECDIDIAYGCRSGSCGECKVKVLQGNVDASSSEGLTREETATGYVLSCVANPTGDCIIDA